MRISITNVAGKGTRAQRLARTGLANHARVSTGYPIRDRIRSDAGIGRRAERLAERGGPVPDGFLVRPATSPRRTAGSWVLDAPDLPGGASGPPPRRALG